LKAQNKILQDRMVDDSDIERTYVTRID